MNYNINQMASQYGLSSPYVDKLKTTSQYISNSFNKDKEAINTQYNQLVNDYNRERESQNNNFVKEGQAAYVDYAKSINPYSTVNASNGRLGLSGSGFSESSLIGANNTYQNRYTDTKNNYENIFADINNKIGKAKENRSIEEAKIAKEEQNQLLQNFWRINESYQVEKAREEEQRRWEQEMALSRAKSYAKQSQPLELDNPKVEENNTKEENKVGNERVYSYLNSFIDRWTKNKQQTFNSKDRDNMVKNIKTGLSKGSLNESQAVALLNKMGVK